MKKSVLCIFILATAGLQVIFSQTHWATSGRYLTAGGKPTYLSGVNYIMSDGWMINLQDVPDTSLKADMAALGKTGVNHLRFFPLWPLIQPDPDKLNPLILQKLDTLAAAALRHNISLQLAPITGWMSGAVFMPPWAVGDIIRDSNIIAGQEFLASGLATWFGQNQAVLGYDFGNELNVLIDKIETTTRGSYTPNEVEEWMKRIYSAFKQAAPGQLVTNGIGTGYNHLFDIRRMAPYVDYFAPHSYAYFHGTAGLDRWYGMRTTYSANYIASWCEMMGKPVVIQEIGCSEAWIPPSRIGDFLRLNYMSTWADGAAGFLWWSSHDIDTSLRVKNKDMRLSLSGPTFAEGRFSRLEYSLGLLRTDNTPKNYVRSFLHSVETVNRLGLNWTDELPVCYIVVPSNESFDSYMPIGITAYVLAKQAHFDVRLCFEGTPIPPGTAAVFIPGLDLNDASRQVILDYLNRGGRVYQSYYNNFGTAISSGNDTLIHAPRMTVNEPAGQMEAFQPIAAGAGGIYRKTSCSSSAMVHAAWQVKQYEDPAPGTVVFASQRIGKGTYFYFAGNLEASLSKIYDPWENSEAHLIYGALRPESAVAADNKYVELYSKSDGKRKLILLLNHSAGYQPVTIRVIRPMCLTNYESLENLGEGNEFTFLLKPGEVVVAMDCESLAD